VTCRACWAPWPPPRPPRRTAGRDVVGHAEHHGCCLDPHAEPLGEMQGSSWTRVTPRLTTRVLTLAHPYSSAARWQPQRLFYREGALKVGHPRKAGGRHRRRGLTLREGDCRLKYWIFAGILQKIRKLTSTLGMTCKVNSEWEDEHDYVRWASDSNEH
jgi:hypothetical protein